MSQLTFHFPVCPLVLLQSVRQRQRETSTPSTFLVSLVKFEAHHSRSFASLDIRLLCLISKLFTQRCVGGPTGTVFACSPHSSPWCPCPTWLRGLGSCTWWTVLYLRSSKNASRITLYAGSFCVNASLSISFTLSFSFVHVLGCS